MSTRDYVWEKMTIAVGCLCDEGTFKQRLENATLSALTNLEDADLKGTSLEYLSAELKFILDLTKRNYEAGALQNELSEPQRRQLISGMLRILNESPTHE